MDSSYLKTHIKWCHILFYYFWFSSYCKTSLQKAAILDLSNMAATVGAQLGSCKILVCYDHIYTLVKIWCLWNNLNKFMTKDQCCEMGGVY